jgi:hypothetical protein
VTITWIIIIRVRRGQKGAKSTMDIRNFNLQEIKLGRNGKNGFKHL